MKKIINEIKSEYRKNKIQTGFMGIVVLLAFLTYIRPGSTQSILQYLSISAINFVLLSLVIVGIWFWRKKK